MDHADKVLAFAATATAIWHNAKIEENLFFLLQPQYHHKFFKYKY